MAPTHPRDQVPVPTPSPVDDLKARLRDIIPAAFPGGELDLHELRVLLGLPEAVARDQPERYRFTWAGKSDAIQALKSASWSTLAPTPDQSLDFDTTEHLFLEGDNLEVLKLLYKPYFGRIKMIYIDPPYNTGHDFIYPDDFHQPKDTYLRVTGQMDGDGNRLTSNAETSGRYHSAWLTMMYPRLFLARQLLRDDGVIFVSIDDHEVANLRILMNEIFGEENFLAQFVRRRRMATGMRNEPVSPDHEYVITFARDAMKVALSGTPREAAAYRLRDKRGWFTSTDLTVGMSRQQRPGQYFPIRNPRTGSEYWPSESRVWRFFPPTMQKEIDAGNVIWPDESPGNMSRPRYKTRYQDGEEKAKPLSTWIDLSNSLRDDEASHLVADLNQIATKELEDVLGIRALEYPKPVSLLVSLVKCGTSASKEDIVLDFFAGSCATAVAVLMANREDGGNRRFIMVQLPEPTLSGSVARDAGYRTIADIGKGRIGRVCANLKAEAANRLDLSAGAVPEDLGFRVFTLAPSSFKVWPSPADNGHSPDAYQQQLAFLVDRLAPGWRPDSLLWEAALKEGIPPTSRVERLPAPGNTVYRVQDPDGEYAALICLDDRLDTATPAALPLDADTLFLCRDTALTDELALNLSLQCRLKTL